MPPTATFSSFLAVPPPGDHTVASLRRKVCLIALRTLLHARASGTFGGALIAVRDLVTRAARRHKHQTLTALSDPDVLPLLLCAASGLRGERELLQHAIPQLLSALQRHGAVHEAFVWEPPVAHLSHGGTHHFSPPVTGMLFDPTGIEVRTEDGEKVPLGEGRPTTFALDAPGLALSLTDSNPLALDEAHPEKDGNAVSLGGYSAEAWVEALNTALGLVRQVLPSWHAELAVSLDRIVPVGFEPERHLSASYREAPGLCYLTLHPSPLTLAEAIVHETQHGKINLLSWLDPVLHNAHSTWTSSPVRPDLRPLWGILLAVHAFVPVAVLHHQLRALDHPLTRTEAFRQRQRQVLGGNDRGLRAVLEKGEPTKIGRQVIEGLRIVHEQLIGSLDEALDPDALPPG